MWNKRFLFAALVLAAAVAGAKTPSTAAALSYRPYPAPDAGYVSDFAGLLNRSQQQALEDRLWTAEKQSGLELAVVTVRSIRNYPGSANATIESFATALFKRYGIGNSVMNNGILLLVAVNDRQARIELGKGYDRNRNADAERIMQQIILPQFKAARPDLGIINGVDALLREFGGPDAAVKRPLRWWNILISPIVVVPLAIICLAAIAVSLFKNGRRGWGWVCVGLIVALLLLLVQIIILLFKAMSSRDTPGGFGDGFGGGSSDGGGSTGSW